MRSLIFAVSFVAASLFVSSSAFAQGFIVWSNGAKHYFGKFTSEQDAIDWIDAHPRLGRPEDTTDEP